MADQASLHFFKQIYEELGSNTAEEVATRFNDEFAALDSDGMLADYLYGMLDIRKADLLTSLKHIENLGVTIDMLVEFDGMRRD